jgi:hypothetical protein
MSAVTKSLLSDDTDHIKDRFTTEGFPLKGCLHAKLEIGAVVPLRAIQEGFCRVAGDPYVTDGTRCKDIVRFTVDGPDIVKAPHADLFHPVNAKSYGNEASRSYSEVSSCDRAAIVPVLDIFAKISGISGGQEVLIQRQRVQCSNAVEVAKTVREGAHQDGVQKLAIFCVDRVNVKGGISLLYNMDRELQFAETLQPGDLLFVNDVEILHDTTPITRVATDRVGYRDIIILTWPSDRN